MHTWCHYGEDEFLNAFISLILLNGLKFYKAQINLLIFQSKTKFFSLSHIHMAPSRVFSLV